VEHAVGCELAGSKRQVRGSALESSGERMPGREATYRRQVRGAELDEDGTLGRLGKGLIEECDLAALVLAAGMALAGPIDQGVGDVGVVDDEPPEGRAVVRTEQPEPKGISERLVEQELASSTLDEFFRSAILPDCSQMPRSPALVALCWSMKPCNRGITRAGLRPTAATSANSTLSATSSTSVCSAVDLAASTATRTGCPAETAPWMKAAAPTKKSCWSA
jgi:hypothetical protein